MPVPPDNVRKLARRALEVRSELPPSKRAGTPVGIARAKQLANGENLSNDTMKRMRSFIARHKPNYERARQQGKDMTDGGVILAMALWGYPGVSSWLDAKIED